jgi:hypothetical protein
MDRSALSLNALYIRLMFRPFKSRTWRVVMLMTLFVSSGIVAATRGSETASAATVPICHATNGISAKVTGENGAATWFYFLITLTNKGATRCELPRIQSAQAISGEGSAVWRLVGPRAQYRATEGISRGAVVVRSRGGKAYVEYYVAEDTDWSKSQCAPKIASAVLLSIPGLNTLYIPFSRRGANDVCTELANTEIGPLSSRTY